MQRTVDSHTNNTSFFFTISIQYFKMIEVLQYDQWNIVLNLFYVDFFKWIFRAKIVSFIGFRLRYITKIFEMCRMKVLKWMTTHIQNHTLWHVLKWDALYNQFRDVRHVSNWTRVGSILYRMAREKINSLLHHTCQTITHV